MMTKRKFDRVYDVLIRNLPLQDMLALIEAHELVQSIDSDDDAPVSPIAATMPCRDRRAA